MSHTWKPGVCTLFLFFRQLNPRSKAFWKTDQSGTSASPAQPLRSGAPLRENVPVHRAGENGGFGTSVMKSRRPDATRTLLASRQEGSLSRCSGRLTVLQPRAGHVERYPCSSLYPRQASTGMFSHHPVRGGGTDASTQRGDTGTQSPLSSPQHKAPVTQMGLE